MQSTLADLDAKLRVVAKAIVDDVNGLTTEIVASVQYEVVRRTPVDVGTARSNFVTRLNSPFPFVYKAYSPFVSRYRGGPGGHMGETGNLSQAVAQARGVMGRRKPDDPVYITNNLPYIARLNRGYSKMAPASFVATGVASGVALAVRRYDFPHLRKLR